jgi:hypothetical protein
VGGDHAGSGGSLSGRTTTCKVGPLVAGRDGIPRHVLAGRDGLPGRHDLVGRKALPGERIEGVATATPSIVVLLVNR